MNLGFLHSLKLLEFHKRCSIIPTCRGGERLCFPLDVPWNFLLGHSWKTLPPSAGKNNSVSVTPNTMQSVSLTLDTELPPGQTAIYTYIYCRVNLSIRVCSCICLCDEIAKWKVEQCDGWVTEQGDF